MFFITMIVITFSKGFYMEHSVIGQHFKINPLIRVYWKHKCMFSVTLEVLHHLSLDTLLKLDFKNWSNFFFLTLVNANSHDVFPVTFLHGNASN